MTRDLLVSILTAASGIEGSKTTYSTQEGHRVSFYLGRDGRGVVVNDVLEVALDDAFVALKTQEQGTMFVPYDGVHSMAVKPLSEHAPKRTGFS